MAWMIVLVLAVVQGVGEFLPISSSGHLVILGALMNEGLDAGLTKAENFQLNIALHFGTLISILIAYRHDLRQVLGKPKLCAAIILATIPAAVLGLLFKSRVEATFSNPLMVGFNLLITAVLLGLGQRFGRNIRPLDELRLRDAGVVGCFQAVSLLMRGVSRSGSTMTGGLLMGLRRETAAAFSFLIAIPALGGATLLMAKDLLETRAAAHASVPDEDASMTVRVKDSASTTSEDAESSSSKHIVAQPARLTPTMLAVGALVSCVVGLASLKSLLKLISQRRLHWFSWYCLAIGLATITWQLWLRK
ncbi:MAG: undecaprenyl-diphosphate phosphatase [Planctomycetaceae bacterium]|nr:undecaprenyl-diphosphate phosphatase [Planctomycetaceae bacterium]